MNTSLIEPKIRNFINFSLKECQEFKERNINFFFNLFMTILLVLLFIGFLYYKYKGKLSESEIMKRDKEKYKYIMSKINELSLEKQKESQDIITNLPTFEKY